MEIDFRLIKPQKFINDYTGEEMYRIPSTVLAFKHQIDSSRVYIDLEIIHPLHGSKLKVPGITYCKSIKIFEEAKFIPPFYTDCKVRKIGSERELIVYRPPTFWYLTSCSVNNPSELNEQQIMNEFKKNYSEFAKWFLT